MLILTQPLNYGGRLYEVGEDVQGKLPLDVIQQLQEGGHIEESEEVVNEQVDENDPPNGDGTDGEVNRPPRSRRNA